MKWFILLLFVFVIPFSMASPFGYNYLDNGAKVIAGNNYTINVNNSYYWQGHIWGEVSPYLLNWTLQTYNTYNDIWSSTYNSTYNSLLNQNCPTGQVVNGTYSNGTLKCISISTSQTWYNGTNNIANEIRINQSSDNTYSRLIRVLGEFFGYSQVDVAGSQAYAVKYRDMSKATDSITTTTAVGNLSNTFTYCMWAYFAAGSLNNNQVLLSGTVDGVNSLAMYKQGTTWYFTNQSSYVTYSVLSIVGDTWYHLCMTRNTTSLEFFVNGASQGIKAVTNSQVMFNNIGSLGYASGYVLNGSLDEIHVWKRQLSNAEIQIDYNSGNGKYGDTSQAPYTDLYYGWHLDNGIGTTISDFTGNSRTGTINNVTGITWDSSNFKVASATSTQETNWVKIVDSPIASEKGIITFGDSASQTFFDGTLLGFKLGGVEKCRLNSTGFICNGLNSIFGNITVDNIKTTGMINTTDGGYFGSNVSAQNIFANNICYKNGTGCNLSAMGTPLNPFNQSLNTGNIANFTGMNLGNSTHTTWMDALGINLLLTLKSSDISGMIFESNSNPYFLLSSYNVATDISNQMTNYIDSGLLHERGVGSIGINDMVSNGAVSSYSYEFILMHPSGFIEFPYKASFGGDVNITGSTKSKGFVDTGNSTINNYYGSVYNFSDAGWQVGIASSGVYYNLTITTSGELNGFKVWQSGVLGTQLQALQSGYYAVDALITGEFTAGEYGIGVVMNGANPEVLGRCYTRTNMNAEYGVPITCFKRLNAGDNLTMVIDDESSPVKDVKVHNINLRVFRVGN